MAVISASVARQTLPAQLDRVESGEEIEITRHGKVVAVLVSPHLLKARRSTEAWEQAGRIDVLLERARKEPLRPPQLTAERAEELVELIRADRSGR
ncbi:MAG: type II toxin-antitoxin system prevent-host-death family antitoxin [Microlunatus sp.]